MNREQKANAQWRQRFEEIGLSKQFEFVERALGQVAHAICNSIKRDSIEVEAHEAS